MLLDWFHRIVYTSAGVGRFYKRLRATVRSCIGRDDALKIQVRRSPILHKIIITPITRAAGYSCLQTAEHLARTDVVDSVSGRFRMVEAVKQPPSDRGSRACVLRETLTSHVRERKRRDASPSWSTRTSPSRMSSQAPSLRACCGSAAEAPTHDVRPWPKAVGVARSGCFSTLVPFSP